MIEVCAVAELFHDIIHIYERDADPRRLFKLLGSFKYTMNDAHTTPLHLLYTGNDHYDSLIDILIINDNVAGVSNGVDNVAKSFHTKKSTPSKMLASTQTCYADRVQSGKFFEALKMGNNILALTK